MFVEPRDTIRFLMALIELVKLTRTISYIGTDEKEIQTKLSEFARVTTRFINDLETA